MLGTSFHFALLVYFEMYVYGGVALRRRKSIVFRNILLARTSTARCFHATVPAKGQTRFRIIIGVFVSNRWW